MTKRTDGEGGPQKEQSLPLLRNERFWGFADFSAVNIGLAIATWAFLIGGTTAAFVGVRHGIAAVLIGNLVGVSLMALAACVPTSKYGIDQITAGRSVFGGKGMRLISVLIVLIIIGWTAVLSIMFARATAHVLVAAAPGLTIGPNDLAVSGLAVLALIITWALLQGGASVVRKFNKIIAPGLVVITAGMLITILAQRSWTELASLPPIAPLDDTSLNFMLAVEFNLAAGLGWWPIVGSLGRYTRTQRAAYWPNLIGLFAAAALGEVVGLMAALALGNSDPTVWMIPLGGVALGIIALLFVAVANLTSLVGMLLSACVGMRRLTPWLQRIRWSYLTVGFLLVPGVMAFFPGYVYDRFFTFLALTSLVLAPLVGVVMADYFFLRHRQLDVRALYGRSSTRTYRFLFDYNPVSLVAVVAGAVVYRLLLDPISLEHSSLFPVLSASLPAFGTGMVVHLALTKLLTRRAGWSSYTRVAAHPRAER